MKTKPCTMLIFVYICICLISCDSSNDNSNSVDKENVSTIEISSLIGSWHYIGQFDTSSEVINEVNELEPENGEVDIEYFEFNYIVFTQSKMHQIYVGPDENLKYYTYSNHSLSCSYEITDGKLIISDGDENKKEFIMTDYKDIKYISLQDSDNIFYLFQSKSHNDNIPDAIYESDTNNYLKFLFL